MSKAFERACKTASPATALRSRPSPPRAASPFRFSYNHDAQQLFQAAPAGTAPVVQKKESGFEPRSVINPRIDVRAQFAFLRLFKGSPEDASDARALFDDVDQGRIKGIFGDDLGVSSRLAAARGTVAWELVPKGQDAVLLSDGAPDTPVIVFRASAGKAPRLDRALLAAHRQGEAGQPQKVTQHGTFTVEGETKALSSNQPFISTDTDPDTGTEIKLFDTHAHRPQIEWKVRVTQNGPLSECLAVGFLQTLTENDVRAEYSPAGTCSPKTKTIPIRDGFASTPVWFQLRNARGKGFDSLGTCQIPSAIPPVLPPIQTIHPAVELAMTDDPGGFFPLTHPKDSKRTLSSVHESLTFHTWLAVKPEAAPENNSASYRFLQHLVWTVRRDIDVRTFPSGDIGFTIRVNQTKIGTHENGRGSQTPTLGTQTANEADMDCTL